MSAIKFIEVKDMTCTKCGGKLEHESNQCHACFPSEAEPCGQVCPTETTNIEHPRLPELSFADKLEAKKILYKEIQDLRTKVQPLLDEIVVLSCAANADTFEETLDRLAEKTVSAKELSATIKERECEFESITIKECCEKNFAEADKFCGQCGDSLGESGWLCINCPTRNKEQNCHCRGCGQCFVPPPRSCSVCGAEYPGSGEDVYCRHCGGFIL